MPVNARPNRIRLDVLFVIAAMSFTVAAKAATNFLVAADFSDLAFFEAHGVQYKDNGQVQDAFQILKNHGFNCVRLRLWTSSASQASSDPYDYTNNLAYNLPLALRVKQAGLLFSLDFHYSDTWADPGHQKIPAVWSNTNLSALVRQMYAYNSNTIAAFAAEGAMPDYVQVGNEITGGMLWPVGQVNASASGGAQWDALAALMKSAIQGISDAAAAASEPMPKIVIHIDRGGDWNSTQNYFNNVNAEGIPFDIIGESYYPFYQGSLSALANCITNAGATFGKPVIVAETAFPWTNTCPSAWLSDLYGYPPTVAGQVSFITAEGQIINSIPNGLAAGVFYWGGEYQAVSGLNEAGFNTASLWDTGGNLLPVADAVASIGAPLTTGPPVALTMAASTITATNAALNAQDYANGAATAVWFQWGPTTNYGSFSPTNTLSANYVTQAVNIAITNLAPSTTYHFQAVAANDAGTNYGGDLTFVTPAPPPAGAQPANLYQEDFGAVAGGGGSLTFPDVGWSQVVPSAGGSSAGIYSASGSVDVNTSQSLPPSSAYYYGGASEMGIFFTTNGAGAGPDGDSAFTSIDPTLYSNLTFSVETQQSYQGGNVSSWFAVQVGGAWYMSTTPISAYVESTAGADYSLASLVYNPTASGWTNLTIGGSSITLGQTAAANLSGPITGIGVMVAVETAGSWDYNNLLVRTTAPHIVSQPASQAAIPGGSVNFSVGATAAPPLFYQWQFNHANLPGATNSILFLSGVQATNAGPYDIVLTNSYGAVTSSVATLDLTGVPVSFLPGAEGVQLAGGQSLLQIKGLTGQGPVEIDASTNLLQWVPIYTNPAAFGAITIVDTNAGNFPRRFYRATTPSAP